MANTEPNAVTGEAPDPDRASNWLDEGIVAPDPEIWAVERRAAQDADSASIWTVEKPAPAIAKSLDEGIVAPDPEIWAVERRAAQDADSVSTWTVEKPAPAIAKS